jgi:hypothetical protein
LSSLCEQKDLAGFEVIGFLEEMKRIGFCPGMIDHSYMITLLVNQGTGFDTSNVLCKM